MGFAALHPLRNFFQHGYVTNDFERAKAQFAAWGVADFLEMRSIAVEVGAARQATLSVALGYYGSLQIEIIQPEGGDCDVYREILPGDEYAVRLHHHGFLVYDQKHFGTLKATYAERNQPIMIEGINPRSGNHYFYADTRAELGHYVEYIYLTKQGIADYARIPQNLPD